MIMLQYDNLINGFVERSKEILRDNLVGVYLHGSSVMDCFNPQKSDIDLIIVVDQSLSESTKRKYMDMVGHLLRENWRCCLPQEVRLCNHVNRNVGR